MTTFENVTKVYKTKQGRRVVLDDVSVTFPAGRNIGILGRNGAGKSTLTRLLAGNELPDSGRIRRSGSISFPIGFGMGFVPYLNARQNVAMVARLLDSDPEEVIDFVRDFAELGDYFNMPLSTYSSGMRARLTFATAFGIDFDTYLIDELIEVGDLRFREKCARAFTVRMNYSNFYVISHNQATIRRYCDMGAVLKNGKITLFDELEDAIRFHMADDR